MSRKIILSLAAVATLAGAALMSNSADAMMRSGGHSSFSSVGHVSHVGRIGHIDRVGRIGHRDWRFHRRHIVRWHHRIWVRPVGYAVGEVDAAVAPGPCTCLTKNYTPEGMVVFQDLCTKEMASAPVDGSSDQAQAEQRPADYAGQTYQDYLKAHPEAKQLETKRN